MSRVLFCLNDACEEQRLADALFGRHECLTLPPDGSRPAPGFDVCVIDAAEYARRPELVRLRNDPSYGMPAFLLVVSHEGGLDDARDLSDRVDDFLVAPADVRELSARIDRLLSVRRARRDVADARRLEAALARNEARFAEAEALAHAGFFELWPSTGRASWSGGASRLLGHDPTRETLSFESFLRRVDAEDRPRWEAAYATTTPGSRTFDFRVEREGEIRTLVAHVCVQPADSQPPSLDGTIVDVTEQRRVELREATANEMTRLAVRDRPVTEFIGRGMERWKTVFPGTFTVVLLASDGEHSPRVGARTGLPPEMEALTEVLRSVERLSPISPRQHAPLVFEDVEKDPRCAPYRDVFRSHGVRGGGRSIPSSPNSPSRAQSPEADWPSAFAKSAPRCPSCAWAVRAASPRNRRLRSFSSRSRSASRHSFRRFVQCSGPAAPSNGRRS